MALQKTKSMIYIGGLSCGLSCEPAGTVDHQASASLRTPSGTCILDQFYAVRHAQIQEQPE